MRNRAINAICAVFDPILIALVMNARIHSQECLSNGRRLMVCGALRDAPTLAVAEVTDAPARSGQH